MLPASRESRPVHLGREVMLIVNKSHPEELIYSRDQHKEIRRIRGMDHIDPLPDSYLNRQEESSRERVSIFQHIAEEAPRLGRGCVTQDADTVNQLSMELTLQRWTDHSYIEAGIRERLGFPAHSGIAR